MYYDFHTASAAEVPAVVVYLADDTGEQQREIAVFPIHNGNVTEAEDFAIQLVAMLNIETEKHDSPDDDAPHMPVGLID